MDSATPLRAYRPLSWPQPSGPSMLPEVQGGDQKALAVVRHRDAANRLLQLVLPHDLMISAASGNVVGVLCISVGVYWHDLAWHIICHMHLQTDMAYQTD